MSLSKRIDDYFLEYGNERFLEGWNGQLERVVELLETELASAEKELPTVHVDDLYSRVLIKSDIDLLMHLLALIKGEQK